MVQRERYVKWATNMVQLYIDVINLVYIYVSEPPFMNRLNTYFLVLRRTESQRIAPLAILLYHGMCVLRGS